MEYHLFDIDIPPLMRIERMLTCKCDSSKCLLSVYV